MIVGENKRKVSVVDGEKREPMRLPVELNQRTNSGEHVGSWFLLFHFRKATLWPRASVIRGFSAPACCERDGSASSIYGTVVLLS